MTSVPVHAPTITERQNDAQHLNRMLACSHEYKVAMRWHTLRMLGTLVLALASPIVVLLWPDRGDLLAAIAAVWLVIGRTAFSWFEDQATDRAVRIHEQYDTRLFGLSWNRAVAGREPSPDDIAAATRKMKDDTPYRDWYTVDVSGLDGPSAVVLCQRQSAVWARRDHRAYAFFLLAAAVAWFVLGLVIALARDLTLADYLIKLFLPSAPAYLDATELGIAHWRHSEKRQQLEDDLDDLWARRGSDGQLPTLDDCRRMQDASFAVRKSSPRVPGWFYRTRRSHMTEATTAGARILREGG